MAVAFQQVFQHDFVGSAAMLSIRENRREVLHLSGGDGQISPCIVLPRLPEEMSGAWCLIVTAARYRVEATIS
jgi:hypothetical protein